MALTLYSTRFFAIHDLSGPASYTVPDGLVAVVRDLDAFWGIDTEGNKLIMVGSAGQVIYQASWDIGSSGSRQWTGRQVLYAGETLQLDTEDVTDVSVSGYLLTAP